MISMEDKIMNNRIKELAEQATIIEYGVDNGFDRVTFDKEKFARLLIEECIEQCWTVSELESNGYVVSECSKKIRKHFGVEDV